MINSQYNTRCSKCGHLQKVDVCNNCENTTYRWHYDNLQCTNPACRNEWHTWGCTKCKTANRFKETLVRQHRGTDIALIAGSFFACSLGSVLLSEPSTQGVGLFLSLAGWIAAIGGLIRYSTE